MKLDETRSSDNTRMLIQKTYTSLSAEQVLFDQCEIILLAKASGSTANVQTLSPRWRRTLVHSRR
jgi:hypothetical protein